MCRDIKFLQHRLGVYGNNNEDSGSFKEKRHFSVGYRQI